MAVLMPNTTNPRKMLNLAREISFSLSQSLWCLQNPVSPIVTSNIKRPMGKVDFPIFVSIAGLAKIAPQIPIPKMQASIPISMNISEYVLAFPLPSNIASTSKATYGMPTASSQDISIKENATTIIAHRAMILMLISKTKVTV